MKDTIGDWKALGADAALIILLVVMAYLPVHHAGFLWDDDLLITQNRVVKAPDGLYRIWFTTEAQDYYPLTESLWWLEWRLWHMAPSGYHAVNVLLHAINSILVWIGLRQLKIPRAWIAGLVFALHPVNVATVGWISEQKNTLSMLFYAVAILLYLQFDESGRWRWYGFSLAAFLLAMLAKSAVVMLPVVLLGCIWWMHARIQRKDFLRTVPFFAFSLVMGLVTIWFHYEHVLKDHPVGTNPFLTRLLAASWAYWFYLYKALLPFHLTVIYPKWVIVISSWISYLPGVALIGVFSLCWWKRRTWGRPLLFGLGYFMVTLFPVLGFFDQSFYRYSLVADHWQYYSIVGAIALAVAGGESICRHLDGRGERIATLGSVAVLMLLGGTTWMRGLLYANPVALWNDNLAKNPTAWVVHANLAGALKEMGKMPDAITQYEQALQIDPESALTHNNLGLCLWRIGDAQDAIGQFQQALRIESDYVAALDNLGVALCQAGKTQDAVEHWSKALQIMPDDAAAYENLGIVSLKAGKLQEAVGQFQQAVRFEPGSAGFHYELGVALEKAGRVPEAIEQWKQAVRIRPDYAEALARLRAVP